MKKKASCAIDDSYSIEVQQMMNSATQCLNCGTELRYLQRKEGRRNRGYCSLSCFYSKSPKMAYVEKEYSKPIREVFLEMLNAGTTVEAMVDRLGIGKPQYYKWLGKMNIEKRVVWK